MLLLSCKLQWRVVWIGVLWSLPLLLVVGNLGGSGKSVGATLALDGAFCGVS